MSLSGDKEVAEFKKSVKMGHPTGQTRPLAKEKEKEGNITRGEGKYLVHLI